MTDRIRSGFEQFAQRNGFDVQQHMGRYCRPVVRCMWKAWQEQAARISDMAAALDRSYSRSSDLLKQLQAAQLRSAELAAEVERLQCHIDIMTAEVRDATEM